MAERDISDPAYASWKIRRDLLLGSAMVPHLTLTHSWGGREPDSTRYNVRGGSAR